MLNFFRNLFSFLNIGMAKKENTNGLERKKKKIQQILNCFETGKVNGDYTKISIFYDGPGNRRQITYGRSQTTEWGNLKALMEMYVKNNGRYADFFKPYLSKIKRTSLVNDSNFINKLKEAGRDPVMIKTQDDFFDKHYWKPAIKWATDNGFTEPLSMLVIYDSFIHSGSILMFLRRRFRESPPAKGGREKVWIEQYLKTRHSWLADHSRRILRKTIYRTNAMKKAISNNDWKLDKPFNANGINVD